MIQVMHAIGELLNAGAAVAIQPFGDGRLLVEGSQELDLGVLFSLGSGANHGLRNTLLLVHLAVQLAPPEHFAVELDGLVEIGNGQADVIDADEKILVLHARHSSTWVVNSGAGVGGKGGCGVSARREHFNAVEVRNC